MGMGTSVSTAVSEKTAVIIEDYMFDASTVGELQPEASPSDFHDTWDLDGTDFTPEASPDDEGYWDDFENIVLNGNYEELGSELVTNGDYSSGSTGWQVEGLGWTFNNINASFSGNSFNPIRQNIGLVTGKTYKITFTLNISSGNMIFQLGGDTTAYTTSGTYTIYREATSHVSLSSFISIYSNTTSVFTIDNVSVKQVDPNDRWQLQSSGNSSSSITDKLTISVDNGDFASARQGLSLSNGNTYELSFDLTSNNSNTSIAIRDDDGAAGGLTETVSLNFTGTQTKSFIFTANANSDAFFTKRQSGSGTYTYSIDNVILKEYAITPLDV